MLIELSRRLAFLASKQNLSKMQIDPAKFEDFLKRIGMQKNVIEEKTGTKLLQSASKK